jgi:hypothetical protein
MIFRFFNGFNFEAASIWCNLKGELFYPSL